MGDNMNQDLTIEKVSQKIIQALDNKTYVDPEYSRELLKELLFDLSAFLKDDIDFKAVVNSLDDSIMITDTTGKIIYVNPSHQSNTGISPNMIIGKKVGDIVSAGTLFTGGAVLDVISTKKSAFRLSSVKLTDPPQTAYVSGSPIFNEYGDFKQIVASSRPILHLKSLKEDFERFLSETISLKETKNAETFPNADSLLESTKLFGNSPELNSVRDTIQKAAPTDATILITGESGVGKEIVADEIYKISSRSNKPFIKINCASIPANLLESELFGYEKGAFSGANTLGKIGLFETANEGTILLDEIGDMPMDMQVKLLRAIQNREITKVGGTKPIPLDIRFIAATNSNLKEKISNGTFRRDLYYRLNVIPINIPPLRERKDDIALLCEHFIQVYGERYSRQLYLSDNNYDILMSYDWPGNVRELENTIEYLTICASGVTNIDNSLLLAILDIKKDENFTFSLNLPLKHSLENYEKKIIEATLKSSHSLRDAGAKLGVDASTISRKIKEYNILYKNSK